jgi:DNA-binding transcriptional LysR family regulator
MTAEHDGEPHQRWSRRWPRRWCSGQGGVVRPSVSGHLLEVTTTQQGPTELVAAGFDAGIHLGESIQKDMVAVRVSRDQRLAVVGSPDYFAAHPKPRSPHGPDFSSVHQPARRLCGPVPVGVREERRGLVVDVRGPLIVDNADLMIRAAIDGLGLTFSLEEYVSPHIARGALVRVLEDWCAPFGPHRQRRPRHDAGRTRLPGVARAG